MYSLCENQAYRSYNIYQIIYTFTYYSITQYPIQDHIFVQLNLDCRYLHPKKNNTSNWWIDACSSGSNMFKPFWTLLALICSNFESLHFTQSAVAQMVRSNASVHHFDTVDHSFATCQTYPKRIQACWTDELWDGNRIGKNRTWNDLAVVSIWGNYAPWRYVMEAYGSFIIQEPILFFLNHHGNMEHLSLIVDKPSINLLTPLYKLLPSLTRGHGTMKHW